MSSSASPTDFNRAFRKELDVAARAEGKRAYDAFAEWLELSFIALSAPVWKLIDKAKYEAGEDRYLAIVARLRDKGTSLPVYSKLLALLIERMEKDRTDALSGLFMDIAANEHIGQFFTPPEVCRLMAEMTVGDAEELLAKARAKGRSFLTLQEPASGAGGMVIATSEAFRSRGLNPAKDMHWTTVDVDIVAVRCCYIQMTLLGISGIVIHGNTLTLDEWSVTPTLTAVLFPKLEPKTKPVLVAMREDGQTITVTQRVRPLAKAAE